MTDREFVLSTVRDANPRPAGAPGPAGEWSTSELLSHIEARSETMDTLERRPATRTPREGHARRKLVVAAAAVVAVIVAIGIAIALGGSEEENPPVLNTTTTLSDATTTTAAEATTSTTLPAASPSEVLEALTAAISSGEPDAIRPLFSSTASDSVWFSTSEEPTLGIRMDQNCRVGGTGDNCRRTLNTDATDWDGDGVVTGIDYVVDEYMWLHAQGATEQFTECTDGFFGLTCQVTMADAAFRVDGDIPWTITFFVRDGQIASRRWVGPPLTGPLPILFDEDKMFSYIDYVRANDANPDRLVSLAQIFFSPETLEDHKRLIAEWAEGS